MGSFSLMHWLIVLVWIVGLAVPVARILKRTGYSPAFALLAFVPIVNLIALWAFAWASWDTDRDAGYRSR